MGEIWASWIFDINEQTDGFSCDISVTVKKLYPLERNTKRSTNMVFVICFKTTQGYRWNKIPLTLFKMGNRVHGDSLYFSVFALRFSLEVKMKKVKINQAWSNQGVLRWKKPSLCWSWTWHVTQRKASTICQALECDLETPRVRILDQRAHGLGLELLYCWQKRICWFSMRTK